MAYCGIKNHFDKNGIKGYFAPKNANKLNPHAYKIINNKKYGGMLDNEMKSHPFRDVGPAQYEIVVDMAVEQKKNPAPSMISKKPRQTISEEIIQKSKKYRACVG